MDGKNKIALIGTSEIIIKIEQLFSKAGFTVIRAEKGFIQEMSDAALILESLGNELALKEEVLSECARRVSKKTALATSTSGAVNQIGRASGKPEKVIGLNFTFNPFEEKCLVQVSWGLKTSTDTIKTIKSIIEKTGATVIVVEDLPGLIVDRTMAAVINEAAIIYATNVASKEDVDRITKLCLNWPMGPFEFADYLGIDSVVSILESTAKDALRYLPCRLLRNMVATGKLGRKTGKGFYDYP